MKILLKTAFFFLGIIFFTGGACPSNDTTQSNKVEQTEIYQSYSIDDEGSNYLVTAYFRIGGKTGTTLALSPLSNVTFNGQAMKENLNTTSGTFYTLSVPKGTPDGTFSFTDRTSKVYTNKIAMSRIALAPAKLAVNGITPVALPLTGVPADSASLNLELNNLMVIVSSGPGDSAEAYYDKVKNAIIVLPAAWSRTANGNIAIDLEVRDSIPTQQGTKLGGEMTFLYDSPSVNASLAKAKAPANKPSANTTGTK